MGQQHGDAAVHQHRNLAASVSCFPWPWPMNLQEAQHQQGVRVAPPGIDPTASSQQQQQLPRQQQAGQELSGPLSLLPGSCRLAVVKAMDARTRAAWRMVCKQACQDVYACATTLTITRHVLKPTNRLVTLLNRRPPAALACPAKCPNLTKLVCANMAHLPSIYGLPPGLTTLDLSYCTEVRDFAPLARCAAALRDLCLFGIQAEGWWHAKLLAAALRSLPHLQRLDLGYAKVHASFLVSLPAVLSALPCLQFLSLDGHQLSDAQALAVAPALAALQDLRQLNVRQVGFGAMQHLLPSIGQLAHLTQLNMRLNNIGAIGAPPLVAALQSLQQLAVLDLAHNSLRDTELVSLAPALASLPSLVELNLANNHIWSEIYMAQALSTLTTLEVLDLSWNAIGHELAPASDEAGALAGAFGALGRLRQLNLSGNFIDNAGIETLAPAIKGMTCLVKLGLEHNRLDGGAAQVLSDIVMALPGLQRLAVGEAARRPEFRSVQSVRMVAGTPRIVVQEALEWDRSSTESLGDVWMWPSAMDTAQAGDVVERSSGGHGLCKVRQTATM